MRKRYTVAAMAGGFCVFLIAFGVALGRAEVWSVLRDGIARCSAPMEVLQPYGKSAQARVDEAIARNHSSGLMDRAKWLLVLKSLVESGVELQIPMTAILSVLFLYIWDKRMEKVARAK